MVVYADVLFFFNCIIDFLLIGITATFIRTSPKAIRQLIAAILGGISSFYIFVDANNYLLDIFYRLTTSFIIIGVAFGFKRFPNFLKALGAYFGASIFLFGVTYFIYSRFKTPQIAINNTYFYFNFSPLISISITTVVYLLIKLIRQLSSRRIATNECKIEFNINGIYILVDGFIDSGNLARDYLSDSELCFVTEDLLFRLTGYKDFSKIILMPQYKNRYRAIPITTLNETSVLEGLRCDGGRVIVREKVYFFDKPIIVVSNNLPPNSDALISAKALEKSPDKILKGDKIETY
ncbi:MAG: sigma-E processing peptidase SpoIIGA [Clostridia bacterium]|nr:sigma-E processing peptidase SpoIIGA [Clostridia bacterium]